jgi:hypothetical protein
MKSARGRAWPLFRVWITRFEKWQPQEWHELPPRATAVEPADASAMSAHEAIRFLEGFNRTMLARLLPIRGRCGAGGDPLRRRSASRGDRDAADKAVGVQQENERRMMNEKRRSDARGGG